MKPLIILFLSLFFSFTFAFSNGADLKSDNGNKRVLVVGFINEHLESNTFTIEKIAKENNVSQENVKEFYNRKVTEMFIKSEKSAINFIECERGKDFDFLANAIDFKETKAKKKKENCLTTNLDKLSPQELATFMKKCNVDYILFINKYDLNWEDAPQYKLHNQLHCDVYNRKGEKVISEIFSFITPKLTSIEKNDKKIQKQADKISGLIAKAD
jgi:hypothetical protein